MATKQKTYIGIEKFKYTGQTVEILGKGRDFFGAYIEIKFQDDTKARVHPSNLS